MEQAQIVLNEYKEKITQATDLIQLRQLRESFHQVFNTEFQHGDLPVTYWLNQVFDLLIRQVVIYTEHYMQEKYGFGDPPVPYAFLLFGSGGRREQVLGSDQDNGLIYQAVENSEKAREIDHYFERFAECLTNHFITLGFSECSGRVLCTESRWRKNDKQWYAQVLGWLQEPSWENVRFLLVLADARCIYGQEELLDDLRARYYLYVQENMDILTAMLRNTLHRKVLIGIFGNLIKEPYGEAQGGIDIKYGAYVPFVNAIRLLAIRYQIPSSSTFHRMKMLRESGYIDQHTANQWEQAFLTILNLRAQTYLQEDEQNMFVSEGKLKANQLSAQMIAELKSSMRIAKKLQTYTRKLIVRDTGGSAPWI